MATIHYLPPANLKLPRRLRSAVNKAAWRQPHRRAVLERRAVRLWLECGADVALQRLTWG